MGRFYVWVGKRKAAARDTASRSLHVTRHGGSPPIELRAGFLSLCAALLAACRRVLTTSPSVPVGVGRRLPSRVGRRQTLADGPLSPQALSPLADLARRSSAGVRDAALSFRGSAAPKLKTIGEARPEDGLERVKGAFRGPGHRRRRRGVALGVTVVAVVLGSGLGLTGAMAAPGDPPFIVQNTADAVDANINGVCAANVAGAQKCTLRAAIQEANARPGADTILIEPGTYAISIAPINENAANVGDFEILDPVTIEKPPGFPAAVIIDGGNPLPGAPVTARGLDRLFEIHPGAGNVTFRNVTLQNGFSPEEGGAIQNWSLGKVTLEGVTVKDNYAEKAGGGLNAEQQFHAREKGESIPQLVLTFKPS